MSFYYAELDEKARKVVVKSREWDGIDRPEHKKVFVLDWKQAIAFSNQLKEAADQVKAIVHKDSIDKHQKLIEEQQLLHDQIKQMNEQIKSLEQEINS